MNDTEASEIGEIDPEDLAVWQSACTLADLGELTAQFLEGRIHLSPTHGGPPDDETTELIAVLSAANRAGFVTEFSQPGEDEAGWIQRAAVSGFASEATFRALLAVAAGADLMITAARAGVDDWGTTMVVSIDNGRENTWAGGSQNHSEISYAYADYCQPQLIEILYAAWQVTLVDPQWGRDDVLWPVLQAFADSAQHMTETLPGPVHD